MYDLATLPLCRYPKLMESLYQRVNYTPMSIAVLFNRQSMDTT